MENAAAAVLAVPLGVDLGDCVSHVRVLDLQTGQGLDRLQVASTPGALRAAADPRCPTRLVVEAETCPG